MNKNQLLEQTQTDVLRQTGPRWFATLAEAASVQVPGYDLQLLADNRSERRLYLGNEVDNAPPLCAEQDGRCVIFDGVLVNQHDLRSELGDFVAPAGKSDA